MNITVLGATGRTGTLLVEELLRRGRTITALVPPAGTLRVGSEMMTSSG